GHDLRAGRGRAGRRRDGELPRRAGVVGDDRAGRHFRGLRPCFSSRHHGRDRSVAAESPQALSGMLERNSANYAPLTPVAFLRRSAEVYPAKIAVIHGDRTFTYREFEERCRRLASALRKKGIGRGDTVAVMAPNVPALLEAHYAVPGIGAILNALNYRLDAATIAFCLEHGEAKALITDAEFAPTVRSALGELREEIFVVDIDDPEGPRGE